MDSHFASAGGCIGNTGMALAPASVAVTVGVSVNGRYNPVSYQKSASCNAYDPYAGGNVDVRTPSVYPYDADVEYKEQQDLGRSKINHLQMAGTNPAYITKVQQQPSYNYNSCYNNYNQNTCVLPQNNSNYYPYSYEQHYHYQQQQQHNQQQQQQQSQPQHQQNFHQNPTLQHPQYKYGVKNIGPPQQYQHLQQQQPQLPNFVMNTGNTMKMSPPEYGQPSYSHIKHPYHNTSYHHPPSQKGGTDIMRPGLDTGMLPYVNNKMVNSTISPATHSPQYPSNYSYQPHNYPSSLPPGHHTYQNQNACDDNRWVWSNGNSNEFSTTCRSSCPAYMNGSTVKQNNMWPSVPMQYQQALSGGYSATGTATNQNCCTQPQSAGHYYPQQYPKYPVQSMPNSVEFNSNRNDLYNNIQDKSICNESAPVTSSAKAYTDLSSQNQTSAYQIINSSSMSYNNTDDCHSLTPPDYNSRYLQQQPHQYYHPFQQQQQQQSKKSPSPSLSTSTYTHYYHNPYPFSRQSYAIPEPQPELYTEQQIDNKTSITTKSQNLRDFLTSWNEDEDECTDRSNINSSEMPYIETLHGADNFTPSQDQAHIATMSPIIENHLQFKGSFTSRPKIHVGITVDSTVESDQYINLPDIIIDIEKSNKDVVSMTEDVIIDNIPKPEKPESLNKDESEELMPKVSTPKTTIGQAKNLIRDYPHLKRLNQLRRRRMVLQRNRRSIITNKRNCRNKNYQRIPSSLKTLCLSLINSDKFRSRFQELNGIDIFNNPPTITDNAVRLDDSAILQPMTLSTDNIPPTNDNDKDISKYNNNNNNSPSISLIPKLSDLCKNALNSSFDRDVLVINIDEFLDSDNLYVVQCDINENIVETYVDEEFQPQQQQHQQELHQQHNSNNSVSDNVIENFNDNNNNYNSTSSNNNYTQSNNNQTTDNNYTLTTPTNRLGLLKRCHSISEVSNLPLHNALMRSDNLNSNTKYTPPSPSSDSCPASLDCTPLPSLINTNCSTLSQISLDQGQFHEMLILTGIVNDATNTDFEDPSSQIISHTSDDNDDLLLLSPCPVSTPSIHHEEIVPDNLKRFQKEKFFKYLHAKYVQRNLSQFYHANRIIKKYRKYLIKNILNIVR